MQTLITPYCAGQRGRLLAALAYVAGVLVPYLYLYSARRQPLRHGQDDLQSAARVAADRHLARRGRDVRRLGLYYGLPLILEKFVLRDVLARVPSILRRVLTFLLVAIGWVPFFSDTLAGRAWLARMFSAGGGFMDAAARYCLRTTWPVLLIVVFAALLYGCRSGNRFFRPGARRRWSPALYFIGLLLLCIAGMVNGRMFRSLCAVLTGGLDTCFIHRKN